MRRVRCIRIGTRQEEVLGTVEWEEFGSAHSRYISRNKDNPRFQLLPATRLAELGGFGYAALETLLGHPPRTWKPDRPDYDEEP